MLPTDVKVTSQYLREGALIFALIDAIFVPLLAWKIQREWFHQLKWILVLITAIFWGTLWTFVISSFWETVYSYVFPAEIYWLIPLAMSLFFAALALLFRWLVLRLPGHVVINFCLMGGLTGIITHLWAISRGILDKPPMLQGAAPVAAVVIAFFEYIFYWCIVLSITWLVDNTWHWFRHLRSRTYVSGRLR